MVFIVQLHDKSIRVNINDKTRLPSSHQITDPKSPQKAIRDAKLFSVCNTSSSITAVCVSIDRIPQNTAPICCLSFDEIGARHPGMTHDAGAKSPARSSFPLSCHPQKPRVYPPRELRLTNNTSDRKANGEIRFQTCWRSTCGEADAGMPGCRTPIRSKGKQRVGAVFCGIRSIETQTAVS
jgi:hypothetical protein